MGRGAVGRPGRAADDGPRAARAVRLPAPRGRRRRVGPRRALRPSRCRGRGHRAGRCLRARPCRAAPRASRRGCPPSSSTSRCGWPPSTARRRRARCRSAAAEGHARARPRCGPRRRSAPATQERAERPPARAARARCRASPAATSPRCAGWRRAGLWASRRASCAARRCTSPSAPRGAQPELTADQAAALRAIGAARRASGCCCTASPGRARPRSTCRPPRRRSRAGRGGDRAGPRDRADPADRGALRRALRRHRRRPALQALAGRAPRRVGAAARGGGAGLRRPALGRLRPDARTRPRSWSTRSTTPPTSTRATRATTRAASPSAAPRRPAPCSWPAARRRARSRSTRCARLRLPARVDGAPLPPVEIVDMREARRALHPRTHEALDRRAQGDRAAQPPRLVELPDLPLVRAGVGVPAVRRHARPAPRATGCWPAITAAIASACPTRCDACGSVSIARHGTGHRAPGVRARAGTRSSASTPRSPTRRRVLARLRGGAARRARRHADGGQGPRLPRRRPRRRARRRRDAALPRLPRRGAHLRARHAARRARRARGAAGGRVLVQTLAPDAPVDPLRRRATTPTASSPASSSAAARCATRRSRR